MKRRLSVSVRRALKARSGAILFGIALGAGLLLGAGLGHRWSSGAVRSATKAAMRESHDLGAELDAALRERRRAVSLLAGLPSVRIGGLLAREAFNGFLQAYPEFVGVDYSINIPPVPNEPAEGPRTFQIRETGQNAALTAVLRPEWPAWLLPSDRKFGRSEDGLTTVLVGRRGGRTSGLPSPLSPESLASQRGNLGLRFWTDHEEYLTAVHPLENAPGLAVFSGYRRSAVAARSQGELLKGITLGGLVGLVAGAMAWGGVARSTRRLRAANETLERRVVERTAELAAAERSFRGIFENVPLGLYHCDREGRFLRVNGTLATTLGYDSPEAIIAALGSLRAVGDPAARERFLERICTEGEVREATTPAVKADGTPIWLSERARAVRDEAGEVMFIEGAVHDVTAQRELEAQLRRIGETDALTGLLNRRGLTDAIATAQTPVSFVVLDVDHFKAFNDTYGHPAGDRALQAVASAVRGSVRASDAVARAGGEEFVVVLPLTGSTGAQRVAESLRAKVAAVSNLEAPLTISAGVATATTAEEVGEAFVAADRALYLAKEAGRNRVVVNGAKLA